MEDKKEQLIAGKRYYHIMHDKEEVLDNIQNLSSLMNQLYNSQNEQTEDIRFSQGELYYQLTDYEAAIFKWENVKKKELSSWALKNIGDAYQQLGDIPKAESVYISIEHPSTLLKNECLLSLFHLYYQNNLIDKAHKTINKLVENDWKYQSVYQIALSFYEETEDYISAFALIVNKLESSYQENLLQKLQSYLEVSKEKIPPSFITSRLIKLLWKEDRVNLLKMFHVFNDYYKKTDYLILWLDNIFAAINETVTELGEYLLGEKPQCFFENIEELFLGNFELRGIQHIIEYQLRDYFHLCPYIPLKRAIGSLLIAWKQHFPDSFSISDIKNGLVMADEKIYKLKDIRLFYENIVRWMNSIDVHVDAFYSWWTEYYLNNQTKKLMVSGSFSNGKSSFINSIAGTPLLNADHLPTTSAITILDDAETEQVFEFDEQSIRNIGMNQLKSKTTINHDNDGQLSKDLIYIRTRLEALSENRITLIDTPGFNDQQNNQNPTYEYLGLADEMLFILSAETPFKKTEKEAIQKIMDIQPNINISFLLNKIDYLDEDELEETIEDLHRKLVKTFHKDMLLIPYSSADSSMNNHKELYHFFNETAHLNINQERVKKVLPYLGQLLNKFEDYVQQKEKDINNHVLLKKKEVAEMKTLEERFIDYKNTLKSKVIQKYLKFNTSIYNHVKKQTHKRLLSYSNKINEYSDLNQVQHFLDQEINKELKIQLKETVIPQVYQIFSRWLVDLRNDMNTIKHDVGQMMTEMGDIMNSKESSYPNLAVTNCWEQLDIQFQQFVETIEYTHIDTFIKVNPMKTILNGVGKLLGSRHNAATLKLEQYRTHLETKLFNDATDEYVYQITKPLGEFENIIRTTFESLFKESESHLKSKRQESTKQMVQHAQALKLLYDDKDSYFDTIDIFKIKLRQLEIDFSIEENAEKDIELVE
jgi:hypothetical protein